MCEIAGKIDFPDPVDTALLERICDVMVHRAPDGRGIFNEPGAGLAAQRPAIIDVAGGAQPIFNESGTIV